MIDDFSINLLKTDIAKLASQSANKDRHLAKR